ncbi:MAG: glycine/betaine ABC transporter substrate-binding protein, partial [Alphaproteobacteria bacterium]
MTKRHPDPLRRGLIAAGLAAMIASAPAVQAAELGAVDEPIRLAIHEWTGQHITTRIIGSALQEMGYKVEYITAGYLGAGTAIADGNLTASLEVWDNNMGEFYPKLLAEGKLLDIGDTGIDAGEGWLYPAH